MPPRPARPRTCSGRSRCQDAEEVGLLALHRGGETFADLGGLDALKSFCLRALRQPVGRTAPGPGRAPARASRARARASSPRRWATRRAGPTLVLDVGPRSRGAWSAQTEADAARRCGMVGDARRTSRSSTRSRRAWPASSPAASPTRRLGRLFGTLLAHMADHPGDVVLRLHGQRHLQAAAGVHPGRAVRRDLLPRPARAGGEGGDLADLPRRGSGSTPASAGPRDRDWTGAEIKACCRLAALLDVPLVEAAQNIVPVAVTAGESVERLRRLGQPAAACRPTGPASTPAPRTAAARPGRNVRRDPSSN